MHGFDETEIRRAVETAMEDVKDSMRTVGESLTGLGEDLGSIGPDLTSTFTGSRDPNATLEREDTVDRTFDVSLPAELELKTVSGRVTVRGGPGNQIRVHAVKNGSTSARANTAIEISTSAHRVSVQTRGQAGGGGIFGVNFMVGNLASVDYEIEVPHQCAVRVSAVSADVHLEDVSGATGIKTVSGDARVENVNGNLSVHTVSGDVEGKSLHGELTARTTSGDSRFRSCALSAFNLNSVSGDFSIETSLTAGRNYTARTVSGDLHLLVPPGTGATVQLKSVSGDTSVQGLPVEVIKSGKRRWQGRINGGGSVTLEMTSVSGDLRLSRSDDTTMTPAPLPAPEMPDKGAETARILDLLAQGEINVDEAMSRLRSLE